MKKLLILAMVITVSVTLYCQEKKEIKEKLKSLKGDVQEITIKTDKETITFKGKDAEYVFKNIKKQKEKEIKVIVNSEDDDDVIFLKGDKFNWVDIDSLGNLKKIILDKIDADSLIKFKNFKFDFNFDDSAFVYKNIKVEMNDDTKKIIIMEKDKDGNETEKIYEGEEADKKLKELEAEGKVKTHKKTIIIHEKDDKDVKKNKE